MARIIGIGHQDFTQLIASGCFYVDKTEFIREWWENMDTAQQGKDRQIRLRSMKKMGRMRDRVEICKE